MTSCNISDLQQSPSPNTVTLGLQPMDWGAGVEEKEDGDTIPHP